MKRRHIKRYIATALALLLFWAACFGVVFMWANDASQSVAYRRAQGASQGFESAIIDLTENMMYQFVWYGGNEAHTLEELYPVIDNMTQANPDEYFCIMDKAGNLYAENGRLLYWVGEDVRQTVDENGYAVTYLHEIFGTVGNIAIVVPVEGSEFYYLMRVVPKEAFAETLAQRITASYEYVAVFNGWGDLMVLQTADGGTYTESQVQQAAQAYQRDDKIEVRRLNVRFDYDTFVPIRQPSGWFLSVRISGGSLLPTFGVQLIVLCVGALLSLAVAGGFIGAGIRRARRGGADGQGGDTDPLTGLYTAPGLEEAVHTFFRRATMRDYSLVYMDIASFRRFNAMFGHKMGDALLRAVGGCIKKKFYCGARPNSDIFVFVIRATEDFKQDVEAPINEAVRNELGLQYLQMVSFNYGIFPLLQEKFNFREASDGAMVALRHAKGLTKGNEVIYDLAMLKEDRMNKHIEVNMLYALSRDEFKMYIQPKFTATDVRCCGGEALVRWQSEQMGLLSPFQFIPLFERNGFIVEVDFFMLESILQFQKNAVRTGMQLLPISVNQSRVTLSMPNYIERIKELVGRYDVPLEYVNIEITESILTENYDAVLPIVFQLHDMGFSIDMDDFGKGYSSLNTLRELPVDVLKIDKEFLRESDTSQRGRRIIESVINLARSLDIETVCEGVETGMQLDFLQESGCDMVQGY